MLHVKMSEGMPAVMKDVDSGRDDERDGSPSQPKRGTPLLYMQDRRADATQVFTESSVCAAWVSPGQRKPISGNNAEVYNTSVVKHRRGKKVKVPDSVSDFIPQVSLVT